MNHDFYTPRQEPPTKLSELTQLERKGADQGPRRRLTITVMRPRRMNMTEPRVCPSSSYAAKVRLEDFNPTCRGKVPVVVRIGALALVILVRII